MHQKKIGLITGGGVGIGSAVVKKLAKDKFDIILHYNKSEKSAKKMQADLMSAGVRCFCIKADFSIQKETENFVKQILARYKRVDFIIHNASAHEKMDFQNLSYGDAEKIFGVNIFAPFFITKALLPLLLRSDNAKMIFMGSSYAFIGGDRKNLLYTSSKATLIGLTRSLAKILAPHVSVNMVVPGYIKTKMFLDGKSEKDVSNKISSISLKKLGSPSDIADLISFLLSNNARYITGQIFSVNGGLYFY